MNTDVILKYKQQQIERKRIMKIYIVEKCSNFTDGYGPMNIHRVFENLEDARNYIMEHDGIFGSEQHKVDTYYTYKNKEGKEGLLRETWNGYNIAEWDVIPKQPEPEKNWRFSYKVFYPSNCMTNGKERPFEFINETEYEGKYLTSEMAKSAVDDLLKNPKWEHFQKFKPGSSQKWETNMDSDGKEVFTKIIYGTMKYMDKEEGLFYQFKVYKVK